MCVYAEFAVLCAAQCGSIVFGNASLQYLAIRYTLIVTQLRNFQVNEICKFDAVKQFQSNDWCNDPDFYCDISPHYS